MLPSKAFLDLVLRGGLDESGLEEEQPACNPLSPLTPGCSAMLALAVTGIFFAVLLLFGLPLYMRYRVHRAKLARLEANSTSRFTAIPIRSKSPRPRNNSSAKQSEGMPPGYGSAQPYLGITKEKAQGGMSPMLTRDYPGRPATPPAVQVRDGFPTAPSYDSLAYYNEKLPGYVVEDKV
ncbi:hypothetical protein PENSPDRAFT_740140 [Peniophora sp. CONT]|nr:hypothetical protein PENSPDRAFT_740140 [Peniophora sp. CONT]